MNKTITQDEIEKAAEEYCDTHAEEIIHRQNDDTVTWMPLRNGIKEYFKDGANYALGKQEKDADAMIQGWVCRDKEWDKSIFASDLFLAMEKPKREEEVGMWHDLGKYIPLNTELFPDLTWESEPQEVDIIIKRKKNGNNSTDNRI